MRTLLLTIAASALLVGCGSLGSSTSSSSGSSHNGGTTDPDCEQIVTKTGVVENCS